MTIPNQSSLIKTSLAPWLSVRGGAKAVAFYQSAFGAKEVFLLKDDSGAVVARMAIGGAEFWLSDESPENENFSPASLGGATARMILTVADPDAACSQAVKAGAIEVSPVREENGWRVGRVKDPFGHSWEIGCPLSDEAE